VRLWHCMHICEVSALFSIVSLPTSIRSTFYSQCVPGTGGGSDPAPAPTTTAGGNTPAPTGGSGSSGGLNTKFIAKGKTYFGTEIDQYHLNNNPLLTVAKNSFGQVTPENSMKWDAIEREYSSHLD
jgi:endo-1,4-beta-xylanase